MVVAGFAFLGVLLPLTLASCWLAERWLPRGKLWLLLAASMLFYTAADPFSLPLLLVMIAANYGAGLLILRTADRARSRTLFIAVAGNIAVLAAYKLGLVGLKSGHPANVVTESWLPLGLSFFTLQQITFLVDLSRTLQPPAAALSPPRYAAYVAFFPTIMSGPILRYRDAEPQWRSIAQPTSSNDIARGLTLLVFGLGKVILIAHLLRPAVEQIFQAASVGEVLNFQEAWLGAWGSLLYLYASFSGYSDMAIGMALAIGLRLPVNFFSPLKARSTTDLLDRWHISLIVIIRSYLFTPLFSAIRRRVPGRGATRALVAWSMATSISFIALAAWHSLSLPFLISAILVSSMTIAYQLATLARGRRPSRSDRQTHWFGHAWVVVGFTLFAILTRVPDLATAGHILGAMGNPTSFALPPWAIELLPAALARHMTIGAFLPHGDGGTSAFLLILATATLIVFAFPNTVELFHLWEHPGAPAEPTAVRRGLARLTWSPSVWWALATALIAVAGLSVMLDGNIRTSIYAQY